MERESRAQFESRKVDHLRLALSESNQASGGSGLEKIELIHEALPDLDYFEINLSVESLGRTSKTPFVISSMTAGHDNSLALNRRLAEAASIRGWSMGVGSQRRELHDYGATSEWREIRKSVPKLELFGNIGLAQVIQTPIDVLKRLVEGLEASAMIVHLNALQECLQPEGTPQFKGGLKAIENLCKHLGVQVVVKETGCGISLGTVKRLDEVGVAAIDVSGFGGTHWGRIEGARLDLSDVRSQVSETLKGWGIPTAESVEQATKGATRAEIWASGGIRSGLDSAKVLAMGSRRVGLAQPILEAATLGDEALNRRMQVIEEELRTVMFCTGTRAIAELNSTKVWRWRQE